jgi:hypothetical protein
MGPSPSRGFLREDWGIPPVTSFLGRQIHAPAHLSPPGKLPIESHALSVTAGRRTPRREVNQEHDPADERGGARRPRTGGGWLHRFPCRGRCAVHGIQGGRRTYRGAGRSPAARGAAGLDHRVGALLRRSYPRRPRCVRAQAAHAGAGTEGGLPPACRRDRRRPVHRQRGGGRGPRLRPSWGRRGGHRRRPRCRRVCAPERRPCPPGRPRRATLAVVARERRRHDGSGPLRAHRGAPPPTQRCGHQRAPSRARWRTARDDRARPCRRGSRALAPRRRQRAPGARRPPSQRGATTLADMGLSEIHVHRDADGQDRAIEARRPVTPRSDNRT